MMELHVDEVGNPWMIDFERIKGTVRYYAYTSALAENVEIVRTKDHWLQHVGLFPAHAEMNIPEELISKRKTALVSSITEKLEARYSGDWFDVYQYIIDLRTDAARKYAGYQSIFDRAQDINQANISAAETLVKVSRGTRDASIIGLSVIAAVSTGGLSLALATTGGAGLTAMGTYQDTGRVDKALLGGTIALVPLGGGKALASLKAAGSSRAVTFTVGALIDFTAETTSQVFISEEEFATALRVAAVKTGSGILTDQISGELAKQIGPRLRGMMRTTDRHGGHDASNRLPSLLARGTTKYAEAGLLNLSKSNNESPPKVKIVFEDPIAQKVKREVDGFIMRPFIDARHSLGRAIV